MSVQDELLDEDCHLMVPVFKDNANVVLLPEQTGLGPVTLAAPPNAGAYKVNVAADELAGAQLPLVTTAR